MPIHMGRDSTGGKRMKKPKKLPKTKERRLCDSSCSTHNIGCQKDWNHAGSHFHSSGSWGGTCSW